MVIGTERHESRRIDNQLARPFGPSGRSRALALLPVASGRSDAHFRVGSSSIQHVAERLGLEEGEAIIHPWVNKAIEKAQGKRSRHATSISARTCCKFDDVMNDQRKVDLRTTQAIIMRSQRPFRDHPGDMRHDGHRRYDGALHIPEARLSPISGRPRSWSRRRPRCLVRHRRAGQAEWADEEGVANEEMLDRLRKLSV